MINNKFKCNNGKCDPKNGSCKCDHGYSLIDNCKDNRCPGGDQGCGNGKCIGPVNNNCPFVTIFFLIFSSELVFRK